MSSKAKVVLEEHPEPMRIKQKGRHIAYLIIENGIDGKGERVIVAAFWHEAERDQYHNQSPSKAYQRKEEEIVDVPSGRKSALGKLDGLEKLLLGLC